MSDLINNRELSVIIWVAIFMGWTLSKSDIRKSIIQIFRIVFSFKLLIPLLIMSIYVLIFTFLLFQWNLWSFTDSKSLIIWYFGVAIILFYSVNDIGKENIFFEKLLFGSFTVIAIVEFFVNLHPFALWIELLLFPTLSILIMVKIFSESKDEYTQAKKLVDSILTVIGIILFIIIVRQAVSDFSTFANYGNIKSYFLPIVYSIAIVPFIYLFALIVNYESIYKRLKICNPNSALINYSFFRIILNFNIRLFNLLRWSQRAGLLKITNKSDVKELIRK